MKIKIQEEKCELPAACPPYHSYQPQPNKSDCVFSEEMSLIHWFCHPGSDHQFCSQYPVNRQWLIPDVSEQVDLSPWKECTYLVMQGSVGKGKIPS